MNEPKLTEHQNKIVSGVFNSEAKQLLIKGSAGVGKTYIIPFLLNKYLSTGFHQSIACAAPTHKALAVLQGKIQDHAGLEHIDYMTVHGLLQYVPVKDRETGDMVFVPMKRKEYFFDVIIIDEASMLSKQMLSDLKETFGSSIIIYIGDDKQLPPVETWLADSPIFKENIETYNLTEIIRQAKDNPIIELSNNIERLWTKDIETKVHENKGYHVITKLNDYLDKFLNREKYEDIIYLAYNVKMVEDFNLDIIMRKYDTTHPKKLYVGEIMVANSTYYMEDDLILLNNDNVEILEIEETSSEFVYYTYSDLSLGLDNDKQRSVVSLNYYLVKAKRLSYNTVIEIPILHESSVLAYNRVLKNISASYRNKGKIKSMSKKKAIEIYLAKNDIRSIFASLNYSYASTVHKSQGSTFKSILLGYRNINKESEFIRRKLFYTAVTRASDDVLILKP